jgi:leucine dehydrogenase
MIHTELQQGAAPIFEQLEQMGHEQVVLCQDAKSGLKAIIGVHNTILGPAIGGTRMWQYQNEQEAIKDALRLSRGMTLKNAIAGLNAGGGKAVIIGNAKTQKTEVLLRSFGKFVHNLNGTYITAEDVGMTGRDMEFIRMETPHVSGIPEYMGGLGDPGPFTAYGTYLAMKAAAKSAYGSESLSGKKVAIQGVGSVGAKLAEYLKKEGCELFISDFYPERALEVAQAFGATRVGIDEIYDLPVDIYSPCALGATLNTQTLDRLRCELIVGCANNQLEDEAIHGQLCLDKGILYGPDFLVNSGGVINVYAEFMGYNTQWTTAQTEKIYDQTLHVLRVSSEKKVNAQQVAIEMAMKRIQDVAHVHQRK